jgi:hypothetical protein
MTKAEFFNYHKERLDYAFNFMREFNENKDFTNRIDDKFLISLNRHLQRKRFLTTKQHIALEEFLERWQQKA